MCLFRRIIYAQCAHAYPCDPNPALKCPLQLAYEAGDSLRPCGVIAAHSFASLRVHGRRCRRCGGVDEALCRLREEIGRAKGKLRLGMGTVKKGEGEEKKGIEKGKGQVDEQDEMDGEDEEEGLSPVALTFSSVVLGVPVEVSPLVSRGVVGDRKGRSDDSWSHEVVSISPYPNKPSYCYVWSSCSRRLESYSDSQYFPPSTNFVSHMVSFLITALELACCLTSACGLLTDWQ